MNLPGLDNAWFLLAALPCIAVACWIYLRTQTPLSRTRRYLGAAGLFLACLGLLAGAAGLYWNVGSRRQTVWVLVDRSLSAGNRAEVRLPAVLRDLAASLGEDDLIGVVSFSDVPQLEAMPQEARRINPDLSLAPMKPSEETFLASALSFARQRTPPGTSSVAVVISDGHDSTLAYGGDLQREARAVGVRVFALPVDSDPAPEVALADFAARVVGREKSVLVADVVVYSTVRQSIKLTLSVDRREVAVREITVDEGRTPLRIQYEPPRLQAAYVVEASIAAEQDTSSSNNTLKLPVRGPGEANILLVHGEEGPDEALLRVLRAANLRVVAGPAGVLPSELVELSRYQVVVLSDVAASEFSTSQHAMLERFVRQGGGLAMVGGPRSFAPGGYYETAVERALPVTCNVTEKGRKQVPAMVIALDRSGSMGASAGRGRETKMDLANEGCVLTLRLIPPDSFFGMLSTDTENEWIIPLGPLKPADLKSAEQKVRRHSAGGGGINMATSVREALARLRSTKTSSRHLVLFVDGSDADEQEGVVKMIESANRTDLITVSVICLGDGKDVGFLKDCARAGQGRFELVRDAASLPVVFSREAAQVGGNFIREEEFQPFPGMSGFFSEGYDFQAPSTPPLLGFVAVTARENADVWLWTDKDKERPLLASWHYGLGKSMAFTSDARDRWADRWLPWGGYAVLWQRWIRWLLPQPEQVSGVESEWAMTREGPEVTLSFFDSEGSPRQLAEPLAEVSLPDGTVTDVPMVAVGVGAYRIRFPKVGSGVYATTVRERPPGSEQRLAAREHQVFVPLDELRRRPANVAALAAISRMTGGRVIEVGADLRNFEPETTFDRVRPLDAMFWLALAGMFMALCARRFPTLWRPAEKTRAGAHKEANTRALSARAAFDRVRERLDSRVQAARPAASATVLPSTPPRPVVPAAPVIPVVPVAEAPVAPSPEAPSPPPLNADSGLIGAMRRVKRELKSRQEGQS